MASSIRKELVIDIINRANVLMDRKKHNTLELKYEFVKQAILNDKYLTEHDKPLTDDEKSFTIRYLNSSFDNDKISYRKGTKRTCKTCQGESFATSYCEICIRKYLKANFSNWTSENDDIDNLIQSCQMETSAPDKVVEWIPHDNLQYIKYLTRGGCSEIYTADWINGKYSEWDSKERRLKRIGTHKVVLKKLENVERANRTWFDESKSHLTISNRNIKIVRCYGLTKDPLDGNYMLVMSKKDTNLRDYLQQNHHKITWKERIDIIDNICTSLYAIHKEKAIHRDLHSGNILSPLNYKEFLISDLGFCGPVDKSLKAIYGNLPYIAPEVISGKKPTFSSDIYSIAMLMWEVSSGQPPFTNFAKNFDLASMITHGMRPIVISGTPSKYKELMVQCWDAIPEERLSIKCLRDKIKELRRSCYNNEVLKICSSPINSLVINFESKLHCYEDLPEPRNATKEEQEAFHDIKQDELSIPNEIEDFISSKKSERQNYSIIFENKNEVKGKPKRTYSNAAEDLIDNDNKLNDNKLKKIKSCDNKEINKQVEYSYTQINYYVPIDGMEEDDIINNPNLHSDDDDEFEIPAVG